MPVVVPAGHSVKLEKFNELNFKRWQQKMLFYLTTSNLMRFLIEDAHSLKNDETYIPIINKVEKWMHCDFLCINYVFNGPHDSLYNIYITIKTIKELRESLYQKYKCKDTGTKKFIQVRVPVDDIVQKHMNKIKNIICKNILFI